jgi:hypothetical protein
MQNPPPTLERMETLLGGWEESGDSRAVFLGCYRLMTLNMLEAVRRREFHDPEWVEGLLHHFAGYYFRALEGWQEGDPDTPAVWRLTFEASERPETPVLRHLMLGVNAHINYDLIFTLVDLLRDEWPHLGLGERRLRRADHRRVNEVIHRTVDAVQDTVLGPRQPSLQVVDRMMGRVDEWAVARLIRHWREEVWRHSVELLEAGDPSVSRQLCRRWEVEAVHRGGRILGSARGESP